MKLSQQGLDFLCAREGVELKAYRDSRGLLTIGVGHRSPPPRVTQGMEITRQRAMQILAHDLAPLEADLNRALKVDVTQWMYDAMVSLGHNIGAAGLVGSTVVHMTNRRMLPEAGDAFLMWDHPPELLDRRKLERDLYLNGVYA